MAIVPGSMKYLLSLMLERDRVKKADCGRQNHLDGGASGLGNGHVHERMVGRENHPRVEPLRRFSKEERMFRRHEPVRLGES